MATRSAGEDSFMEVKRRKRKRKRVCGALQHVQMSLVDYYRAGGSEASLDGAKLVQTIATCREQLKETSFFHKIVSLFSAHILTEPSFSVIVCYGIGRIGTCYIARQQFALLLEAIQLCQPHTSLLFDPILCEDEKAIIKEHGCQIIEKNEHCKHHVQENTLFFMPHCGKAMYNNLLWANWNMDRLSQVAIIGNSFNSYYERLTEKQFMEEALYLYHASKLCREVPFPSNCPDDTVFNDTSLHLFPQKSLKTACRTVWQDCPEPSLNPSDPEIII